jgi:hypothetical protein
LYAIALSGGALVRSALYSTAFFVANISYSFILHNHLRQKVYLKEFAFENNVV